MTPVVLLILTVIWTVYLVTWVRHRRDRRGVNSISSFSRHLSVLERTSPARPGLTPVGSSMRSSGRPAPIYPAVGYTAPRATMSLDEARRRRRTVLFALAAAALVTLLLVPFMGALAVAVHVLVDVLLAGYVLLLIRNQRLAVERREKVRYLPHVVAGEPQYLLRQSAN